MGLLDGKVAFVTGAARGQGRSHAIRLAQEGADIIALDACATPEWLSYPLATEADLRQTVKEVEALDRRIVARKADTRDLAAVRSVLDEGLAEFGGRLDIVAANAAIISWPAAGWPTTRRPRTACSHPRTPSPASLPGTSSGSTRSARPRWTRR